MTDEGPSRGFRFNPPPSWPRPPAGWTPPAGWKPDPSWPPAPPGWDFWLRETPSPPALPEVFVPRVGRLEGQDGTVTLDETSVTLEFRTGTMAEALKKSIGVRRYPLTAIGDVHYVEPSGLRSGALRIVPVPGTDLLRPYLKDQEPGPKKDPDTVVIPREHSAAAQQMAQAIRTAITAPYDVGEPRAVRSGSLPLSVGGTGGQATFDGVAVVLEFGGWQASPAEKRLQRRVIPLEAVQDVTLQHPGISGGWIRFVLVGGQPSPQINPADDPNTLRLAADRFQTYALLAAAVKTALLGVEPKAHPELLTMLLPPSPAPLAPAQPAPTVRGTPQLQTALPSAPAASEHHQQNMVAPISAPRPVPTEAVATSVPTKPPSRRERRQHERALQEWYAEQTLLQDLARAARAACGPGGGANGGVLLKKGEHFLWGTTAKLVEPRKMPGRRTGSHAGVRVHVAKGVNLGIGGSRGHYIPGPEVQTPVDSGQVIITTRRALFTGARTTREWSYTKLIGIDSTKDNKGFMIHVENRQKVSGVILGKDGERFQAYFTLGVTISETSADTVAHQCEAAVAAHAAQRP